MRLSALAALRRDREQLLYCIDVSYQKLVMLIMLCLGKVQN
jgi:hypothetical protein